MCPAAIQFGIDYDFDANKTQNVFLYNMGSGSTKGEHQIPLLPIMIEITCGCAFAVTLARYSAFLVKDGKKNKTVGQFDIVASAWDDSLGGLEFEHV